MRSGKTIFIILTLIIVVFCCYLLQLNHCKSTKPPPNIVLILVDALRKDHLGCYGYHRNTSPNIDVIAANGTVFNEAISQGSNTLVAVPSLFTGRYPSEHGLSWAKINNEILVGPPLSLPTIADILSGNGYATCGISGSPIIGFGTNTNRGFEHFDQSCGRFSVWQQKSAKDLNVIAYKCLNKFKLDNRPFFLYMHYMDPHNYYKPPKKFIIFGKPGYSEKDDLINKKMNRLTLKMGVTSITEDILRNEGLSLSDIQRLVDLYDSEIRCVDHYIGELVQTLKDKNLYNNTLIIITSDHGECFMEHGNLKHGGSLYRELINVPLIFQGPGIKKGLKINDLVEQIDIAPTIFEIARIQTDIKLSGQSFASTLKGKKQHLDNIGMAQLPREKIYSLQVGFEKLIVTQDGNEYYDVSTDPGETNNLSETKSYDMLNNKLKVMLKTYNVKGNELTNTSILNIEALKALGYVE